MRRLLLVVAVAALMAAMLVVMAIPALAFERKDTNSQGNCIGRLESRYTANGTGGPGSLSDSAKNLPPGTLGKLFSLNAKNC